jgi:hypothetical protein
MKMRGFTLLLFFFMILVIVKANPYLEEDLLNNGEFQYFIFHLYNLFVANETC